MHPSGFNQVIVTVAFPFLLLLTILHICLDIVWSKEPFCIFFFLFYFFSFVFLQSLIGGLYSFPFEAHL